MISMSLSRASRLCLSAILCVLIYIPCWAQAEQASLYKASIAVRDQSTSELNRGFDRALHSVLTKLTGQAVTVQYADLIDRPDFLIAQYDYELIDDASEAQNANLEDVTDTTPYQYWLHVTFSAERILSLLREIDVPYWAGTRPNMLFWLVVQDGRNEAILSEADDSALNKIVAGVSQRYALPVTLPLMDLEDRAAIKPIDIKGSSRQRIERASRRYKADYVLSATLRFDGFTWSVSWSMRHNDQEPWVWRTRGQSMRDAIDEGFSKLAVRLVSAASDTAGGDTRGTQSVYVSGIRTLSDYAALLKHLKALPSVTDVQVVRVTRDVAQFSLKIKGGAVRNEIVQNNWLEFAPQVDVGGDGKALYYRLSQ